VRFISFFAGIGGIDLGLERAGHECVGQCEIDPYAIKVLEKHWPDVPRFGDITKVKPDELPEADLWAGGFPCQDISNANTTGGRSGLAGTRSGLFFDWMRLAVKVRPRFLLMENVGALINGGLDTVLGTLAESGCDAEWERFPASAFGAPHLRYRVFILAYPNGVGGIQGFFQDRKFDTSWRETHLGEFGGMACPETWLETVTEYARRDDGIRDRMDRMRCAGNAVVPQVAEYIGRLLMEAEQS
jgi:DNA (cytosine-5)-methyltransferase 1